jgi:hypothetical protein
MKLYRLLFLPVIVLSQGPGVPTSPSFLHFRSITYSGTGCPPSPDPSTDVDLSMWYTYTFDFANHFNATLAVDAAGNQTNTNCELHARVKSGGYRGEGVTVPGWQFAPDSVVVQGRLRLDPGTRLDWWAQYYWSENASNTVSGSSLLKGIQSRTATNHCTLCSNR